MMKLKSLATKLIAMTLIMSSVSFMGCSKDTATTPTSTTDSKPKYAIVLKTLSNPFWVTMKEGIEAEAKAKGVKIKEPKLKVVHTKTEDLMDQLKASLSKRKKAS